MTDQTATAAAPPESIAACLTRLAGERPDTPMLTFEDATLTRAEVEAQANRAGRALAAMGVGVGDMVTIALPNGADYLLAAIACWKIGATPQPVSHRLPAAELAAIVELAAPRAVVGGAEIETTAPRVSVADLLARSDDGSALPDVLSPAWKAPTSGGSTGRPKLIVAGQPSVTMPTMQAFWRTGEDDVCLMPGPLYHNGPFSSAALALTAGAHLIVMRRFDAEETLRLIDRHRATWVYTVPTMMSRIWRLGDEVRGRYDVSSLRTLWHLAAPCPPWLKEAFIGWLGGPVVWELYAGTEAQASTVLDGDEWLAHRGSVGRVHSGEMKIVGADGETLPPGEVGEIYMRRTPGLPESYRYMGADARVLDADVRAEDGARWESLGDMGSFDADGYLYLADRRPDMILVGGSNVYPAEVEAALEEHPSVRSCCVIGLPDEDMGSRVHAIIQPAEGYDQAALEQFLTERLLPYKRPRTIELTDQPLRDDAGKVRRSQLRAERLGA